MNRVIFYLNLNFLVIYSGAQVLSTNLLDKKVDSVLHLMTIQEKIGQTNMYNGFMEFTGPTIENEDNKSKIENIKSGLVGGMLNTLSVKEIRAAQKLAVENSRLGIPMLFGYDVIHGYKTMLPVPLAQAASWDRQVAEVSARISAVETASSGLHWTFAPMIDVCRDGRFGRIMEGAGEDPYLTSVMTEAWIKGYQGSDLSDEYTIAACAKHFAAYGFVEAGREYNTADISRNTLYNVALPPFKAAVDAGAATFMNAFNLVDGVPATGHSHLQRDILKGVWGFEGFVVSDWWSIVEMVSHGFAIDRQDAGRLAMLAGSDMDMEGRVYEEHLAELIKSGEIDETLLNDAVRRILRVKFQLGLFDDPYKYCDESREAEQIFKPEHREISREVARKTAVLLKNENDLLPIKEQVKSIAVIGQMASSKDVPLGNWRAQAITDSGVSLLEGIKNAAKDIEVSYSEGYRLSKGERNFVFELTLAPDDTTGFQEALTFARESDMVVMAMGEDCFQTGEGRSQTDTRLKGNQVELLKRIAEINDQLVVVLMTGRPVAIPEVAAIAPSILQVWYGGTEAGNATADILFGNYNPSGRLPVSFPYYTGQEPLHYDRTNTGRPGANPWNPSVVFWSHYTDSPNQALYPFGYGLSYTEFEYSNLSNRVKEGMVEVKINVKNIGQIEGLETVQVYVRDPVATVAQPIKKLVDFKQVRLKPGEQVTVEFILDEKDFGFYHPDFTFYAENGAFEIMVGKHSEDFISEQVMVTFN